MSNLDAVLNFAHINVRREKAGEDDGNVACDLKLSGELGADALKGLFATKNSFERVTGNMWTKDGELASTDLGEVKLTAELTTCRISLKVPDSTDEEVFDAGELNKVRIKPLAGRVCEVSMRLQVHPTEEQIAWLSSHLGYDLHAHVAKRQGELNLQRTAAAGAEAAVH